MTDSLTSLARSSFPQNYAHSRDSFRALCAEKGIKVMSWPHPRGKGRQGESLAVDVAVIGPQPARRVLAVSCATHGIEGFCGAGVQAALLQARLYQSLAPGITLVLIHALNPYGFSHLRRTNEDNIDLNRNFIDHRQPHPENQAYDRIHRMLAPGDWHGPQWRAAEAALASFVAERGWPALQAAVSGGQYDHPDGLFFGGRYPAWSNTVWRDIIKTVADGADYFAGLDFHTGLGQRGHCELISGAAANSDEHRLAMALFGDSIVFPGISSTAPASQGHMSASLAGILPHTKSALVVAEFGTVPFAQILEVLRADNWLHVHGDPFSAQGERIKTEMRDAFFCDADDWKTAIVEQGLDYVRRAGAALDEF